MRRRSNGPIRCAVYLRCSTDDQKDGDFTTIDTQREINIAHVRERGWALVGEYADEGKSGTTLNRPDWKRLLADAEAGLIDVVCVTYMSRLGRGNSFVIAEYELDKLGVRVEMVREKFTDDLAGYMGKTMTTMMDGVYPKMVSQWTKTKMQAMVEKGYFCGGTVPFGYRPETIPDAVVVHGDKEPPKRLVVVPDEAQIVRSAFDLYLEKRTLASVRKYLLSVTTGRNWVTGSVKYLLTNEVYRGILAFGSWRNESAHEPIIEADTFQAIQEILGDYSPRVANGEADFTYYLRGRVMCPHCGCPYTHLSVNRGSGKRPKNRIYYYVCSNANKGKTKCPVVRVNAEALHYTVLHEIERAAKHHTVMHKMIAASGEWNKPDDGQKAVRAQLSKLKQQLEMRVANYIKAIGDGRFSDAIATALTKTEAELESVREKLEALEQEIGPAKPKRPSAEDIQQVWSQFIDLWGEWSEAERTEALGGILERVEVKEKHRVRLQFSPIADVPGDMLALKCKMGAADRVIANQLPSIFIPTDIFEPAGMRKIRRAA
jgi:site-specific DNA recombinase